ncbi:hypothetical protein ACVWYG_000758 [Pedobacter sp. UYEF25]
MARIVVLGAGISGHTAASYHQKELSKDHRVIVAFLISVCKKILPYFSIGFKKVNAADLEVDLKPFNKNRRAEFLTARVQNCYLE